MRYLALVAVCLSVYLIPFLVDLSSDIYHYAQHSLLSLIVIFLACLIAYKPLTAKIILVEVVAMCLDLFTCIEHYTSYSILNAAYTPALNFLCAIEALLLISGAPWDAIHKRFNRFLSSFNNNLKYNSWFL